MQIPITYLLLFLLVPQALNFIGNFLVHLCLQGRDISLHARVWMDGYMFKVRGLSQDHGQGVEGYARMSARHVVRGTICMFVVVFVFPCV